MDNKQNTGSASLPCPECDTPIYITAIEIGKVVECGTCGTESEIVNISPVKLAPLEEEK